MRYESSCIGTVAAIAARVSLERKWAKDPKSSRVRMKLKSGQRVGAVSVDASYTPTRRVMTRHGTELIDAKRIDTV